MRLSRVSSVTTAEWGKVEVADWLTLDNTHPKWWKDPGLRKMMTAVIMLYFNAWTWGYDGTLLNAFQAMPVWQQYFNHPTGGALGIIAAIFYLPAIGTPFIGSFLGDRIGRRATLFGACLLSIAGALLTTFATGRGMLIAGRGVMGAALGVQSTIGPPLMQEICHPRLRARAAAMWFITYQFGTVISAWICYGMSVSAVLLT